jgi:hypothetical protein
MPPCLSLLEAKKTDASDPDWC